MTHGAVPSAEQQTERSKPTKRSGGKKKPTDRMAIKKYVLTHFKDGVWKPLVPAELQEFQSANLEVAAYLSSPELLQKMPLPSVSPSAQIYDHWDKAAKRILANLVKHNGGWHFSKPVDAVGLKIPDYYDVIKKPMDYSTIKEKLSTGAYHRCQEFIDDVELVFSNCIQYNGESSDFGLLAKSHRDEFKKQLQLLSLDYYM